MFDQKHESNQSQFISEQYFDYKNKMAAPTESSWMEVTVALISPRYHGDELCNVHAPQVVYFTCIMMLSPHEDTKHLVSCFTLNEDVPLL